MKGLGAIAGRNDRIQVALPLLCGYAMVGVLTLAVERDAALRARVGNLALSGAALVAAVACAWRSRVLSAGRLAWRSFALAALLAAVSGALSLAGSPETAQWLLASSVLLLAVALALKLHERERAVTAEVVLEALLIVCVSLAITLRLLPFNLASAAPLAVTVFLVAALCFSLLRVISGQNVANRVLGLSTLCFGIAILPVTLSGRACCDAASSLSLAMVAGWLLLGFAALEQDAALPVRRPWHSRHLVAPLSALVLAFLLIQAGLGSRLPRADALVLGALGVLLALHVANLLHAAQQQTDVRRELAQSRALIEISHALAGVSDLKATYETVTQLTCASLNAQGAAVLLLTEGGQSLELAAAQNLPLGTTVRAFAVEGSFTGRVIASGKPRSLVSARYEGQILADEVALTGKLPFAMAPLLCRGDAIGALCCFRAEVFSAAELELISALADHAALAIQNAQLFEQVSALSLTDPLTGLANRRQLERDLGREFAAARRGRRLIAVMFDLNGFKDYNDRFGHLAGDQALRLLASAMSAEGRTMNLTARYGGDEFVTLLTEVDTYGALVFVQRVKQHFSQEISALGNGTLTVSAGMAEYTAEMTHPEHLLAAADLALYASKGRRSST